MIWKATNDKQQMEGYVAILKQRIYTKRLPASFNLLDHSIDNTEKLLKHPLLDKDKRTTLSSEREKTIADFKYKLMIVHITTAEEIVRSHTRIIANAKQNLITASGRQTPLPKSLVTILNAIAARQSNIINRAQSINKQQISFFGHAPAVIEEAATVGVIF